MVDRTRAARGARPSRASAMASRWAVRVAVCAGMAGAAWLLSSTAAHADTADEATGGLTGAVEQLTAVTGESAGGSLLPGTGAVTDAGAGPGATIGEQPPGALSGLTDLGRAVGDGRVARYDRGRDDSGADAHRPGTSQALTTIPRAASTAADTDDLPTTAASGSLTPVPDTLAPRQAGRPARDSSGPATLTHAAKAALDRVDPAGSAQFPRPGTPSSPEQPGTTAPGAVTVVAPMFPSACRWPGPDAALPPRSAVVEIDHVPGRLSQYTDEPGVKPD